MEKESITTKLAINLSEGTVQAEGSETFVRFIYEDFKVSLSKHIAVRTVPASTLDNQPPPPPLLTDQRKDRKKSPARKPAARADGGKSRPVEYKPKFNSTLNLAGLDQFFDEWKPINNFEKILVFCVFLRDKLRIAPCTADDVYTCFETLSRKGKTKVPEAFSQAFRDAKHRTNYIEYTSLQEIHITIPGDNRFNEKKQSSKKA